jgi:hypothetical protein
MAPKPYKGGRRRIQATSLPTPRKSIGWCAIATPAPYLCMCQLDGGYPDRLGTFLPLLDLELNALVLLKRAKAAPLDLGKVDEEVLPAVVRGDETEALFAVEPFHSSLRHLLNFSHSADAPKNPAQRTRTKAEEFIRLSVSRMRIVEPG